MIDRGPGRLYPISVKMPIKVAHSPDIDDILMFYGLTTGKISHPDYEFSFERRDIEELNRAAVAEVYDLTALSFHAYAHVADKYVLTASGASMAEKDYGPTIVANSDLPVSQLNKIRIAVPGEWTTAFLILKINFPDCLHSVLPSDDIIPAVKNGDVTAGLVIHEAQISAEKFGLRKILSLTTLWQEMAGALPLPLGGNAIKKKLPFAVMKDLAELQKKSVASWSEHSADALAYALEFGRGLSAEEIKKYANWYAGERCLDMGEDGRKALEVLFAHAHETGLLPKKVTVEII